MVVHMIWNHKTTLEAELAEIAARKQTLTVEIEQIKENKNTITQKLKLCVNKCHKQN